MSVQVDDIYLGSERGIWFIATRVTVVLLLMLTGLLGNGLVLIIYRRDKKQSGAVYIIALAVIDLMCCIILLPQVPISELSDDLDWRLKIYVDKGYYALSALSYYCYLFTQVAMALDQVVAVFRPFKHTRMRKKLNWWLMSVGSVIIVVQLAALIQPNERIWQASLAAFVVIMLVCFTTLIGAYTATALKLSAQGRAFRPQIAAQDQPRVQQQPPPQAPMLGQKRAMHIQALKIYTSILLLFVLTNLASIGIGLLELRYMTYVYYLNHTANPLIYYCFVAKFRTSVKEYWRQLIR